MGRISMSYIDEGEWPPGSVDIHIVKKSLRKAVFVAILLLPFASCIFLSFKHSESVIIMPAFGVQLETHYASNLLLEPLFTCAWEGRAGVGVQGINLVVCEGATPSDEDVASHMEGLVC
ncbi:hypothetical protein V6N11_076469 [Hibiscus sabdariffa]|uniref:Uncharacterized protein n=1 Tax=Hibiscus sabdariffa TaxID=183260 RepID=A0ABR2Q6V4_9ROSI